MASYIERRKFLAAYKRNEIASVHSSTSSHGTRRGAISASQPKQDSTPRCGRRLLRCGPSVQPIPVFRRMSAPARCGQSGQR
jgi:hypothetical protein